MSILNSSVVQAEIRKLELKMEFGPLNFDDLNLKMYGRQFTSITIKKGGTLESFPPIEQYLRSSNPEERPSKAEFGTAKGGALMYRSVPSVFVAKSPKTAQAPALKDLNIEQIFSLNKRNFSRKR